MTLYSVLDFGAKGDAKTDNAAAIQKTIDTCSGNGGGRVVFPAGHQFLTGPFKLKSFVELYVERGAKIIANPDESVYTESAFRENRAEGTIWIGGDDAENISITGGGEIDGQGHLFMEKELPAIYKLKPITDFDPRPHLLTLIGCKNVTIKDVILSNAAYWCVHLVGCEDVVVHGIRILNGLKVPNCDGIDPDHSRNVRISDCYIESGDDCICPKTRREYAEYGPCENITVTGCTLISTSCAIKLGSENMDAIRNMVVDSCIISSSNRGIGIQNRDEGCVENVIFSNCIIESRFFDNIWWGKSEPIYVTSIPRNTDASPYRFPNNDKQTEVGKVKNIRFNNIICKSENGVYIKGCSDARPENILFENVQVEIKKWTKHDGGVYDQRPTAIDGLVKRETCGFLIDEAEQITLKNCSVQWGTNPPDYYGHAIESHKVDGLKIQNFSGTSAFPGNKAAFALGGKNISFD